MWMDLEMTGLDVEKEVIVEIAVLATSAATLEPLDAGLSVVVAQPAEALAGIADFVRQMHERSGLLTEIETNGIPLEEAGRKVLEYIKGHVPEPRTVPLCGNSMGWTAASSIVTCPEIDSMYLHYRSIDVSSIRSCRRWYREPFTTRPEKADDHRALPQHAASVELRYYRETIFK